MKRLFTSFTLLLCIVASVVAQGKYAMTKGETPTAGGQITSVSNITMTFGSPSDTEHTWAAAKSTSLDGYSAFTAGNGANPSLTDGIPTSGTFYQFEPTKDGSLTVAVCLNSGKKFYVTENGTALSDYDGITVDTKYYGTYTFDVTGGKIYYVYCLGSKLGFFGFEYSVNETIPQLTAPTITYDGSTGEVTITPANSGETVYYTTDGTTPSATNGTEYTEPFTVSTGTTVSAVTIGDGTTTSDSDPATVTVVLAGATLEAPVISSYNGTVGITCASDDATLYYSTDGTTYTEYVRAFTLTEDATVYAKASCTGYDDVITSASVTVVPENTKTKTIYMGYGSFTMTSCKISSTGYCIMEGNSGDDAEGYSMILNKAAKDYEAMGTATISSDVSRTLIKASNGAQNILYLPEGVKATRLTLYSVINYDRVAKGEEGRVCGWKEINGTIEEGDTIPTGAYKDLSDCNTNPDVRIYPLDNATDSITFTNAGEQAGFVIGLDVVEDESRDMVIVSIGSDGMASYSSDKALDFSEVRDITAYTASSYEGSTVYLSKTTDKLPASTGLLVKSETGKAYRASVPVLTDDDTASEVATNLLVATVEETAVAASTTGAYNYVFGKKAGETGFWRVGNAGATSAAGKAYLQTTEDLLANGAKGVSLSFGDGVVTGINNVNAAAKANGAFYTLSGLRVANPQKGLYIQNGKKVIIK